MNIFSIYRALGKWQKLGLWTGLFFIFYTIFGFFILPKIIHKVSVDKLTQTLERKVSIEKIKFNPYSLFLTIEKFNINEKNSDQPFFSFDDLKINLQTASIFKLGPVIKEVNINGLFINATRHKDQTYNFSDLIPDSSIDKNKDTDDPEPSKPLKFSVSNIVLNNGTIIINDLLKNKTHNFSEMQIGIPFISNLDTHTDIFVTPHFSVNFNGSPIAIEAESKPFMASQTTNMVLDLKGIDLKTYYDYLPVKTNMDLKNGSMDLSCSIEFSQGDTKKSLPQIFLSGQLKLFNLKIDDLKRSPVFNMGEFSLSLTRSEILKGEVNIADVIVSTPNISLSLDNSNKLNIFNLLPESNLDQKALNEKNNQDSVQKDPIALLLNCQKLTINNSLVTLRDISGKKDIFSLKNFVVEDTKLETKTRMVNIGMVSSHSASLNVYRLNNNGINLEALLPPAKEKTDPKSDTVKDAVWNVNIENLGIKQYSIFAKDIISKDKGTIQLENIIINAKGFSTLPETNAESDLSFEVNKKGKVNISGEMGINPLNAKLDLIVDQLNLDDFQPFVSEYLNLILSDGKFSTTGKFSMVKPKETPIKAGYKGNLDIKNFHIVDSKKAKTLIKMNNFGVQGMDLAMSPISASINSVKISKPLINIAIASDGSLNLAKVMKDSDADTDKTEQSKEKEAEQIEKPKEPSIPVNIGQIIMEKGQIRFIDKSVTPNFKTNLTNINTKIAGLSSEEAIRSDINIRAIVNNHTPVEIKGKINPLKKDLFLDMAVALTDMDLGYLAPYSGKYAGYKIQKGKLSLDLKYLIDERKINSENNVFLDQFDFGEKVDSEDAIKAPMRLAVSLLKDPMGRISLDIPVKGDLDDPKFSVGGIIIKVVINLLTKAATAPFALLGAMFGGGEDLNVIAFDPGSFDITSTGTKKVETLIKALTQRPGLNLEIAGYVNIEKDQPALIDKKLEQRLKEEKLKIMLGQGSQGIPVEEIIFTDEEYDLFLKIVFDQTDEGILLTEQINQQKPEIEDDETTDSEDTETVEGQELEITRDQMIDIIKKTIQVTDDELKYLANDRALTIKGAILANKNIDPKRIFIIEAETLEPEQSEEAGKSKVIESGSVIMTLK